MTHLPPPAKKKSVLKIYHGHSLDDPYHWLRDPDWQKVMDDPDLLSPEILSWIEGENAYHNKFITSNQPLVDELFAEIKGRISEDDSDVPLADGPYGYYKKFIKGGQYPLYCRMELETSNEHILIDGNAEAEKHSFFRIIHARHSPDHKLFAYSIDITGAEKYAIKIIDAESGKILPDQLPEAHGDFVFSACSNYIFYTVIDDNHRPSAVKRHKLGNDADQDETLFKEQDPGFFVGVSKTESGRFILIESHDHQTSESHLIDARNPLSKPRLVEPRCPGVEYRISDTHDRFFILTNADRADDFKIMEAPLDHLGRENWQQKIGHVPGRLILSVLTFKNYLVYQMRENGRPEIVITGLLDNIAQTLQFDDPAYALGLTGSYEFDTPWLRFSYSSPRTPEQIFDVNMETGKRILKKQQTVPGGHDPERYCVERLMVPARDGERIPVTTLSLKNPPENSGNPVLLYGYGAYGITIPAVFSTARLSLVDRGFTYAIAHIRGGRDKGDDWYKKGRDQYKTNTFHDFIDVADYLKAQKIAGTKGIAAHGGSAGGMLMGVIANQRPDLFKAIVANVPFVDVLNTMLDDSLPLTPPEWPEWGNPITDKAAFERILFYSPYDNVRAQDYPCMYITAGLTDPRVTYWEPAKWVARLRELKTGNHPLYFKTNMQAGHAGASGRFDSLLETAEIYAFLLTTMSAENQDFL